MSEPAGRGTRPAAHMLSDRRKPLDAPTGSLVCGKRQIIQFRKRAISGVSSESPRTSADLTAQANGRSDAQEPSAPSRPDGARRPGAAPVRDEGQAGRVSQPQSAATGTDFGPNEWLVDELYQRYLADPGSVVRAWWNFFADYHPEP